MQFVSPDDFSFDKSIVFLSMLVVGGSGSIVGSILGATALTLLPELLRFVGTAYLLVFGVLVLLVLTFFPGGLVGLLSRPRWPRRASLTAPVSRREDA
jgi:branched-chain amino acid transport system permease protein